MRVAIFNVSPWRKGSLRQKTNYFIRNRQGHHEGAAVDFQNSRNTQDLGGDWDLEFSTGKEVEAVSTRAQLAQLGLPRYRATVPGNFELDLAANGVISADPFFGMNITQVSAYDYADIWYHRRFSAQVAPDKDVDLVFDGLDCIADIYLNGELAGSTDNMLVEHRLPVSRLLKADNELLVHIMPALREAKRFDYSTNLWATGACFDSLFIRKAPHMYGWDIMPRAISAGIWRPVRLEYMPKERIEQAYLTTVSIARDAGSAQMSLWYRVRTNPGPNDNYEIEIEGHCGSSSFKEKHRMLCDGGRLSFTLQSPALWWPKGRGEPNLYHTTVALLKNGAALDLAEFDAGVRTTELVRTSTTDAAGSGEFLFKVNGEGVFIHGSNWVPQDAFHSRDIGRTPMAVELAEEANCNMLRCWGGNVYESDLFYDLCDQKGILVWQDFALACATYPQDTEFQDRLANEARSIARRLRQHPCIVLWAGDNECDAAYLWRGSSGDPNTNVLTRKVLPGVLSEEDAFRPYIASSPYIDEEAFKAGEAYLPEAHLWGPRDYYKSEFYTTSMCHFISEIGYHGCPPPTSLARFLSADKMWPPHNNDEWLLHCTSPIPGVNLFDYRVELMSLQVRSLFGETPDDLESFALASQISQAEALKFFIEQSRCRRPRTTGILWWNLIDGWPQFSDAVVDYFFERKLAYGFIKRAQQPVHLIVTEPTSAGHSLVVSNETRDEIELSLTVRDADSGEVLLVGSQVVKADGNTNLGTLTSPPAAHAFLLIEWAFLGRAGISHYLYGKPPFALSDYRRWLATLPDATRA